MSISTHTKYKGFSTKTVCCSSNPHEKNKLFYLQKPMKYIRAKHNIHKFRSTKVCRSSIHVWLKRWQYSCRWHMFSERLQQKNIISWIKSSARKACLNFSPTWKVEWPLGPGRNKWSVLSHVSHSCQSSSQQCNAMWGCTFCQIPADERASLLKNTTIIGFHETHFCSII